MTKNILANNESTFRAFFLLNQANHYETSRRKFMLKGSVEVKKLKYNIYKLYVIFNTKSVPKCYSSVENLYATPKTRKQVCLSENIPQDLVNIFTRVMQTKIGFSELPKTISAKMRGTQQLNLQVFLRAMETERVMFVLLPIQK